ncbi:chemotaxis protein LafU [Roseovarius sp. A-2]|uniref:flagellar motor protein MotB n=1 Tax=Roseovarius sp. A-2 TaxID=1570360 RepID=UPI0009B552D2|nr:flagellar motor protein MotB [Roseovarius sp. A-2]GAW34073.1 chemotaxis protein LafU [Roseovarius sp. A-2]
MDVRSNAAPVIIKRKKIIADGGHHGGAWKVAYADFVTAMMAFFLLMWLLNATTEQQRKGIADYFSPTLPVNRISGGGDGAFGGDSVFSEETLAQNGIGATSTYTSDNRQARGDQGLTSAEPAAQQRAVEDAAFARLSDMLTASSGESLVPDDILQHIRTRVTDEGLVIELFDLGATVLFTERAQPTRLLEDLAALIARVSQLVENDMAIAAHVSARPVTLIDNPVWDISSERANRMRMLLEEDGIASARVKRVTGHADRNPAVEDPMAPRNNRLEVILLRSA